MSHPVMVEVVKFHKNYPLEYFEECQRIREKYRKIMPCSDCDGSGWYNEEHSRHDKNCWNECWSCGGIGIDEMDWHWDWDILTEFQEMKKRLCLSSEIEDRKLKQLSEV